MEAIVQQISANLLRDEELLDLIAASGGKWIFTWRNADQQHAGLCPDVLHVG